MKQLIFALAMSSMITIYASEKEQTSISTEPLSKLSAEGPCSVPGFVWSHPKKLIFVGNIFPKTDFHFAKNYSLERMDKLGLGFLIKKSKNQAYKILKKRKNTPEMIDALTKYFLHRFSYKPVINGYAEYLHFEKDGTIGLYIFSEKNERDFLTEFAKTEYLAGPESF